MSELLSKAVLDACVIFRAGLRDTLLRAASAGLYEVYWSDIILQEVSRNKRKKWQEQSATGAATSDENERILSGC